MTTPVYNNAGATSSETPASSLTLSGFAATSGSNRFLEVWVGNGEDPAATPTGVTWGGQALTIRGSGLTASFWNLSKWYIKEADFPGGATGDIVATWAASKSERGIYALVHEDVDQTSPYRNGAQVSENDGDSDAPSISVTSHTDDVVTAGIWVGTTEGTLSISTLSVTTGTERAESSPGQYEVGGIATVAGAATATITWDATTAVAKSATLMMADSLQGAAGGGTPITDGPALVSVRSNIRFN